ncbi:MAG: protein phosphatase 2C domain-containing protein [Deltaproteobacteria bacterium]|nr:protein phosphatase 2C domain-containing protein [Myxococcales bacterium]MDP3213240.1 protein phosphatase 2C domain-containing protein [Deltaproteobacteria bacterium]
MTTPAQPARPALEIRSHGVSDKGRVREHNEDQFLIAELAKAMHFVGSTVAEPRTIFSNQRAHLFAVADGMGGHSAGAEASALAVRSIEGFVLESLRWFSDVRTDDAGLLRDFCSALVDADARLIEVGARSPETSGMGTTMTVAWCQDAELRVLHVGDSRCYLARGGVLHQLTQDHTLVGELVRNRVITPAQASEHVMRHVVTNAVGGTTQGVHVEVQRTRIEPGDALLLCSDGLTGMVADEEICAILAAEPDPRAACQRLITAALEAGGKDNVTVIVARCGPAAPPG